MKCLVLCIMTFAGLFLNGCAGTKTVASGNTTTGAPPAPTVSPAAHGVIGAGTKLAVRTSEAIATVQDVPGKTYAAETINDIVDQGSNILVPKGSRVQLGALASPGNTPAEATLQLAAVSLTVNGKSYQVTATPERPNSLNAPAPAPAERADRPTTATSTSAENAATPRASTPDAPSSTHGRQVRLPIGSVITFRIEQPIQLYGYTP